MSIFPADTDLYIQIGEHLGLSHSSAATALHHHHHQSVFIISHIAQIYRSRVCATIKCALAAQICQRATSLRGARSQQTYFISCRSRARDPKNQSGALVLVGRGWLARSRARAQLPLCVCVYIRDRITPRPCTRTRRPRDARRARRCDFEAKNVIYARRRHKLTRSRTLCTTATATEAQSCVSAHAWRACKCIRICL